MLLKVDDAYQEQLERHWRNWIPPFLWRQRNDGNHSNLVSPPSLCHLFSISKQQALTLATTDYEPLRSENHERSRVKSSKELRVNKTEEMKRKKYEKIPQQETEINENEKVTKSILEEEVMKQNVNIEFHCQ